MLHATEIMKAGWNATVPKEMDHGKLAKYDFQTPTIEGPKSMTSRTSTGPLKTAGASSQN
jgi:hypothetical protein